MDLISKIFKGDKVIWMIFALLCVVSVIEVFSAASILTYKSGNHWAPIMQHSKYLLIGLLTMLFVQNVRYQWFKVFAFLIVPVSFLLLLWASAKGYASGERVNGAARWLEFFGIRFQPSEVAKLGLVCIIAYVLSIYQKEDHADNKAFYWIIGVTTPIILLIGLENFSTAALLLVVIFIMLFIGRVKILTLIKGVGSGIIILTAIVGIAFLFSTFDKSEKKGPTIFHRATTWVNRITNHISDAEDTLPVAKYLEEYGQRGHANIAIASSNIMGVGPGNSIQRDFLSQAFSDFIYAIIIEELGLIGGIGVTLLYIWLLMRIGKIAKKCRDRFSMFLVLGIGLMLVIQAMINMMVAVGLLPITGQPLPLISKGGSSGVINCVLLGMVLSVSYYTDLQIEREQKIKEATTKDELEELNQEDIGQIPNSPMLKEDSGFIDEKNI